ncbi:MAG: sigma 54-interacting transcriptional regulator [Deltaproteobacteria bacterium]|nr:sigma 54-interacting transcriptional regulator [Deltaproteobacteria bacterium]
MSDKYTIFVNDEDIAKKLHTEFAGKDQIHVVGKKNSTTPGEEPFAMILSYSARFDPESILDSLHKKKWTNPVFVLDETFNPAHSKKVWLYPQVAGYLVCNNSENEKSYREIIEFISRRIDIQQAAAQIADTQEIGTFVKIEAEDYNKYNLVSLFVGRMRGFMVELKRLAETACPRSLDKKPDFSLCQALEEERNSRLANPNNKEKIEPSKKTFFSKPKSAQTRPVILIYGDTGTGKSIIAEFIHEYVYSDHSVCWESGKVDRDRVGALRSMTCSNIGGALLESELFGSLTGAYTGAETKSGAILEAYNGTLFLDEIGELTPNHQAKLLQYLQDGTVFPMGWVGDPIFVPTVVVAATNKNLEEMVEKGAFRRDLLHRLGSAVTLPPLRDRLGDLDYIVDFILQNPGINHESTIKKVERSVYGFLGRQEFPGNYRQLEQLLRQAVAQARSDGVHVLMLRHVEEAAQKVKLTSRKPHPKPERMAAEGARSSE